MKHYTHKCLLLSLLFLGGLSSSWSQSSQYTLQIEAMDSLTPALELVRELKASGVDAYYQKSNVPGKGLFYRVRVGNFADYLAAQNKGEQLRRAQLIKEYYVARFEGRNVQASASSTHFFSVPAKISNSSTSPVFASEFVEEEAEVEAEAEAETVVVDVPANKSASPTRRKVSQARRTTVIRQSGVITGIGDVPIRVPFENDDLGSCFLIPTGSIMTAATSMGLFTARDQALGAVIPYAGLEAKLKFRPTIPQKWTPPRGIVAADVLKMEINQAAGYREFYTNATPVSTFGITGGKIIFQGLPSGEYMIRARTGGNKCVFLPLTVKEH